MSQTRPQGRPTKVTPDILVRIKELANQGLTAYAIAEKIETVGRHAINRAIKNNNIKVASTKDPNATYVHEGWMGEPYKSDFMSRWGPIKRTEMLDLRGQGLSPTDEKNKADFLDFKYYISENPHSDTGNQLKKLEEREVNALLQCSDTVI